MKDHTNASALHSSSPLHIPVSEWDGGCAAVQEGGSPVGLGDRGSYGCYDRVAYQLGSQKRFFFS